jgi:DNA-binding CsgD family transcriptional regulator
MQATWTRATQLEAVLDHLAVACLLLDATGRLIHANLGAEAVLRSSAPLRVVQGRIVANGTANQRVWEALLRRLTHAGGPAEGTAAVLDTDQGTPLRVMSLPLTPPRSETLGLMPPSAPLGLVCIGRTAPRSDGAAATLQGLFGLTPAQADLTVALFEGESVREYAERRERSLNTVRTHLKEVFAKTGARRQADLIRQLTVLGTVVR